MRKASTMVLVLAMLMVTSSAFALLDDNSQNSNSAATATTGASTSSATGGSNTNSIGNASGLGTKTFSPSAEATIERGAVNNEVENSIRNSNENRNSNYGSNKQAQGQLQGQGQVAQGEVNTNVTGDTNKVYANTWPSLSAAEGVSSGTASTVFGSLGLSSTESYKKIIPQIQAIAAIDPAIMDNESKRAVIKILVQKMTDSNRKQRLLGVGPEIQGKSLINLFGILSWDSVWAEGQNPFQCKSDIK